MKTTILLLLSVISLTINAQQRAKIYYDNRDNSIVNFFNTSNVLPILAENPISGFSTLIFSVSKNGEITSVTNLIKSDDVIFLAAKDIIKKSSGNWVIKPKVTSQIFQITFYMQSDEMDSLRKIGHSVIDLQKPHGEHVEYKDRPVEITLLPTINLIFKHKIQTRKIVN